MKDASGDVLHTGALVKIIGLMSQPQFDQISGNIVRLDFDLGRVMVNFRHPDTNKSHDVRVTPGKLTLLSKKIPSYQSNNYAVDDVREETPATWIRYHRKPRTMLFHPTETMTNVPALESLEDVREAEMLNIQKVGAKNEVQAYNWRDKHKARQGMIFRWQGQTTFWKRTPSAPAGSPSVDTGPATRPLTASFTLLRAELADAQRQGPELKIVIARGRGRAIKRALKR